MQGGRPADTGGRPIEVVGLREQLEELYRKYNRIDYVHPDPLEFLYRFPEPEDREIAAFISAALAFGRVAQILKSLDMVLGEMGESPAGFLIATNRDNLYRLFRAFRHRWVDGAGVSALLVGLKGVLEDYGSLNNCFLKHWEQNGETTAAGLEAFSRRIRDSAGRSCDYLVSKPELGSACKRLNLFLRWVVRRDEVDPGGWKGVSPAALVVPLDTHMFRVGRALGFTGRKTADMRAALEITECFRRIEPGDPVKYDFCLTRLGIRNDASFEELLSVARNT